MLSLPRGTRDFSPEEAMFISNMVETAERIFRRFGFVPLITPSLELLDILNAKTYGESSTKEIFKIEEEPIGLRYDFTVPMSRFVSMNKDLALPFKRYQIGSIWRKEEPQRMRSREFIQADVDIVGSKDIASDAEVIAASAAVLDELGVNNYTVHLNSRIVLEGILKLFKVPEAKFQDTIRAIDKMYKISNEEVKAQLAALGISQQTASEIIDFVSSEDTEKNLNTLSASVEGVKEEVANMLKLAELVKGYGINGRIVIDLSLARGLDYYTGFVWEFKLEQEGGHLPSIGGGGRYDNLIGILRGKGKAIPATGSSIGISRLFEVLYEETGKKTYAKVFVANAGIGIEEVLSAAKELRIRGINTDVNVLPRSLSKQLSYAAAIGVDYVVIIGENEAKQGKVKLRDMLTGKEELLSIDEAVKYINTAGRL